METKKKTITFFVSPFCVAERKKEQKEFWRGRIFIKVKAAFDFMLCFASPIEM
jgi:hypothetical protein